MELHSTIAQTGIRGTRNHGLRAMRFDLRPFVCASFEASICDDDSRTENRMPVMPDMPPADRSERTRTDVSDHHDPYHTAIRPMTLSRVVSAAFLNFIWWKHIADYATEQTKHYDKVLRGLEDYEKAVKQNAEPKLLSR